MEASTCTSTATLRRWAVHILSIFVWMHMTTCRSTVSCPGDSHAHVFIMRICVCQLAQGKGTVRNMLSWHTCIYLWFHIHTASNRGSWHMCAHAHACKRKRTVRMCAVVLVCMQSSYTHTCKRTYTYKFYMHTESKERSRGCRNRGDGYSRAPEFAKLLHTGMPECDVMFACGRLCMYLFMCVCVCMYVCMYIYIYIYMYIYNTHAWVAQTQELLRFISDNSHVLLPDFCCFILTTAMIYSHKDAYVAFSLFVLTTIMLVFAANQQFWLAQREGRPLRHGLLRPVRARSHSYKVEQSIGGWTPAT